MLYKMMLKRGSLAEVYAEDLDWLKRVRWLPALKEGNGGMIVEVSSGKIVAQCPPAGTEMDPFHVEFLRLKAMARAKARQASVKPRLKAWELPGAQHTQSGHKK